MDFGKDFGKRIRARRTELGLRQSDVAFELGITAAALSLWEKGLLHKPPLPSQIETLSRIYDLTRDFLVRGEDSGEALAARTKDERVLLQRLRAMSPHQRRVVAELFDLIQVPPHRGDGTHPVSQDSEDEKSS